MGMGQTKLDPVDQIFFFVFVKVSTIHGYCTSILTHSPISNMGPSAKVLAFGSCTILTEFLEVPLCPDHLP